MPVFSFFAGFHAALAAYGIPLRFSKENLRGMWPWDLCDLIREARVCLAVEQARVAPVPVPRSLRDKILLLERWADEVLAEGETQDKTAPAR